MKKVCKTIEKAAKALKMDTQKLFVDAYTFVFGARRGIAREAKLAHRRYRKRGSFCQRALRALSVYFERRLEWQLLPET